jgi:hypothetical protein
MLGLPVIWFALGIAERNKSVHSPEKTQDTTERDKTGAENSAGSLASSFVV